MSAPYADYIREYHHAISTGEIIAGEKIKQIYDKVINELQHGKSFFDDKEANRAIRFIENFVHHCETRRDLLKLELWQKAAVSLIFGIKDETGTRLYREVFIVVGRKNGKSLFADAVIAYMAYADKEYGAKIYCIAPKLDQAHIIYDNFYKVVQAEPELCAMAKKRRSDIYIETTNTSIKPLAFSYKKSDGFNPHCVACDELASWPAEQGRKQYEVMKSALGARRQPLILSISTAGYVNDGPYDELMARSTAVLNGTSRERRLLPLLYIIDDIDKWNDIDELRKSNPNMGVSVSEEFFLEEIAIAENSLSKKVEFLAKYCNIKQSSSMAWLQAQIIENCFGDKLSLDEFRGSYCVGGIDLSQTTDLTACCVIIEKNRKLYIFCQFFMPANKIQEAQEREGVPYQLYVQQGLIQPSGENYVDYKDCYNWFVRLVREYEILPLKVGYDRYTAQYLVQDMKTDGFHMDDVYQGENLTPVINECDGMMRDGTLRLGCNQLLKAHFGDSALKINSETRKKRLVKIAPSVHIDGTAAVLDALTVRQKWYGEIGTQLMNMEA